MLRSLQFVQDSVVRGDHSAADMQRFLLTRIDKRLRTAAPSDFEDPRNVDAALIYTMSGGIRRRWTISLPATLMVISITASAIC